jgi:predicted DNA-binding protein (MmcQ/YjbR family)
MNLEELRALCLSFPGATEDVKWDNDLTFSVGKKMFAVTALETATPKISFKCTPEKFAELVERRGIRPADYVARYHWVTIEDADALKAGELKDLIEKSYEMVRDKLPKSLRNELV